MKGTDKVRFCSHCAKNVNNLSEMTRKEATRLVRSSGGSLCIRYIPNPVTRRPMFAEQLLQITRRTPRVTAGVISASMSLSVAAYAQDSSSVAKNPVVAEHKVHFNDRLNAPASSETRLFTLRGTVTDPMDALIVNAKVTITSVQASVTLTTSTDGEGNYQFAALKPGRYMIETEAPGFLTGNREVMIGGANESVADASLGIGIYETVDVIADESLDVGSGMGGAMVSISYRSELSNAVADEDVERVRELLASGGDVNAKEEDFANSTPLFFAVETGNIEIVELLLDFGAKVNARDEDKRTSMMRLDDDATSELVDLLVKHGAKVNLTDAENNTALIVATRNDVSDAVVEALIRAGADVRLRNKAGITALMNAADNDDFESVKLLVEAGSDVNAKDDEGETAYDKTSDEEIEQYLVGHGAVVTIEEPLEVLPPPPH